MEKKKILMVHNYYQIGGGEHTVFNNELELLKKNGHKVLEYTRNNDELNKNKFKLLMLPFSTIWSFKTYKEVKKIIRDNNIDIVHCHNTFPLISPSVYYAARKCNIPVIQTIHNFRFICPNALLYRNNKVCKDCIKSSSFKPAIKNKCYRKSKIQTTIVSLMLMIHRLLGTYKKINYIFLTDFNKNMFNKLININDSNIFVKPNFVNDKLIRIKAKSPKEKFVFIGRLDHNKGITKLIEYWNELSLDFELHIYGDGELKKFVEEACRKNEKLKYYGFRSHNEIFEDLSEAYALIFPSALYEGFPMTITESMGIGKPIISSNIGNQQSIVANSKGGTLFELGNIGSFKKAISDLIKNYETYAKNAKEYFDNNLSENNNYRKLMSIYENAKVIK